MIDYSDMPFPKGRIRLKGEALKRLRVACLRRSKGRCCECRMPVSDAFPDWHSSKYHMAHIKSRGAGGEDTLENVRTLCGDCHRKEHQGKL